MMIEALKSKIHRAVVTQAELNYVGSITIDTEEIQRIIKTYFKNLHSNKYKNVKHVIYGHLHGKDCRTQNIIIKNDIPYRLTSCDQVDNTLQLIFDTQLDNN